jgi:hypothetical protein
MLKNFVICLSILLLPMYFFANASNGEDIVPEGDGSKSIEGKIVRLDHCSKSESKFYGHPVFCKKIRIKRNNDKEGNCIIFTNTVISNLQQILYDGGLRDNEQETVLIEKLDKVISEQLTPGRRVFLSTIGNGCTDITLK